MLHPQLEDLAVRLAAQYHKKGTDCSLPICFLAIGKEVWLSTYRTKTSFTFTTYYGLGDELTYKRIVIEKKEQEE